MLVTYVASALIGWLCLMTFLARRAERRVTDGRLPAPWPTFACALVVIALGLVLRPLDQATICGAACAALVAASGPDARTGYLFDTVTMPAAIVVTMLAFAFGFTANAVAGVTLLVGTFGTLVLISRGRLMGLGDVKAMYAIGVAFGPLESVVAIFAACVSGTIVAIASSRLRLGSEVRFGPHLALGGAFSLVAGPRIVHAVLGS